MDNDEIILMAKKGDVESQRKVLETCREISVPITLQYVKKVFDIQISYEDLRDLVDIAFLKALKNFDKRRLGFYDYFKYLYIKEIQTSIREKIRRIHYEKKVREKEEREFSYEFHSHEYYEHGEDYEDYDKRVLRKAIENNEVGFTKKEIDIMKLLLEDMTAKEISLYLDRNYTETLRHIRRATKKLITYFNKENL